MDLTRWTHRQIVFVVCLLAAGVAYALGGLRYSIPLICVFAVYEVLLMRWVGKRSDAQP
jgi:hypothetical protein